MRECEDSAHPGGWVPIHCSTFRRHLILFRPALAGILALLAIPAWGGSRVSAQQRPLEDTPPERAMPAPPTDAAPRRSADGRLEAVAVEARTPIRVDGVLDEPAWTGAVPIGGFVQSEPNEGAPATERTEVRILYDEDDLYVGAYLQDSEPDAVVVNDIRKDFRPDDQDTFELILDTFTDRRNGYVFITNAEGAKADRQVANEGREINTSWDAPWEVRTQRVADGWTVEMAIPFRALRSQHLEGQPWGVNFSRRIRRRNEVDFWSPVSRAYNLTRVSVAGNLTGLPDRVSGRDLRIKPYLLGSTVRETGGPAFDENAEFGADAKYGLTQGLTLDLTFNPDFAQAEADEQQVNLSQFSQFFPEKREFFLENSGVFYVGDAARNNRVSLVPTPDEDLLLFFSRRIGLTGDGRPLPIVGGARLSGQQGGFTLGALAIRTDDAFGLPTNDYAVLRVRRNVFSGSDVGAVFQTRHASSDNYNRVYGMDANFRFLGDIDWNSYVVRTETPGIADGQYAWRTSLNREGNFLHAKGGVLAIGEGFRDDLGFFRRTGIRKWFTDIGIRPRPEALRRLGVREMHPHIVWNYYEDLDGQMVAKRLHSGYTFFFSSGAYAELSANPEYQRLEAPFRIHPDVEPIPVGGYGWNEWQLRGSTDPSRAVSLALTAITGGLWSGTQKTVSTALTLRPSYRFRATVGLQRTAGELDLPRADFVRSLWTGRANYSFNTHMFVDALAQYDPTTRLVNSNVRFNLIHHPLSDLFIVFNEQRFATDENIAPGRSLVLKVTQMLSF